MPGQGRLVAGGMDEPVGHVLGRRPGGVADQQHAAGGLRLVGDERAALVQARQEQDVGGAHQRREVAHEPALLDAGIVEQVAEPAAELLVDLAAEHEVRGLRRAAGPPRAQPVVQPLGGLAAGGVEHGERAIGIAFGGVGREARQIAAEAVRRQPRGREPAPRERVRGVRGGNEDEVDRLVLGLLTRDELRRVPVDVAARIGRPSDSCSATTVSTACAVWVLGAWRTTGMPSARARRAVRSVACGQQWTTSKSAARRRRSAATRRSCQS